MKSRYLFLIVFISSFYSAIGQVSIEPYQFISNKGDTILAEKGTFMVPEDRKNNEPDSIQLSFVRFPSLSENPKTTIVYLAGGPGGSGIETAKGNRFELFMKLRAVADVIAFDQRGTGLSNHIPRCPHSSNFDLARAIHKEEYLAKTSENISDCLEYWKNNNVNINAYNTTENAHDINDLRKALNSPKISLWGISYGSHLAFEFIRLHEPVIDKVVLASLEGPDETIKLPKNTEAFLFKIADLAKDNYGADLKYPNLINKIKSVHERVLASPISVQVKNRSGEFDTITFSNFELQATVAAFYLKNPEDSKKLPKIYNQMYEGDFSQIAPYISFAKRYMASGIRPMPFAMDFQSGISQERRAIVNQQVNETILGSTLNGLFFEWMAKINFVQLPNSFRTLKPNNVEGLLLSGTLDGRTYLKSAVEIANKFNNGKHVIIENAGHDLYMASTRIQEMVVDFFKGKQPILKRIILEPTLFE